MSGKASGQVWEMHLPRPLKYLLLALAEHANHDGGHIYPGIELLAWETEYTPRNVQRMLRELEDMGIIVPEENVKGGAGNTVHYWIDFDAAPKLAPRSRKRVKSPHTKNAKKGDIPAHQKGDIPARLELEKGEIPAQERVKSPHKKGDISSRARTSIGLNRQEPSNGTVIITARDDEEAMSVFERFCEITNAAFSAMPPATVAAQTAVAAGLLADYSRSDIEGCMRWLQSWRTRRWTMETVRETIVDWTATGRPANGRPEPAARAPTPSALEPSKYRGDAYLNVRGRPT